MTLDQTQKKYLKRNIKKLSLSKIAADLGVSEEEILKFLKHHWRKEKYQKFLTKIKQTKKEPIQSLPKVDLPIKKWFRQHWPILVFLALLVFAVYLNSLGNDFLSDDGAISNNPKINHISYFLKPPYFNLDIRSMIIFFTHKIFGLNPAPYRLTNILFHLGSVWIIYFLVAFFFSPPVSLFAASIFAVHPFLTEAVIWISGGHYSHSAFFALASLLLYILAKRGQKTGLYLTSIILFYLALLASEKLIIFPLILFVYDFCFDKLKATWRRLIPFFAISGFWALYLFGLLGTRSATLETAYYKDPGMENPLIQIPVAISSYLELLFWPKNLTLYHSELIFTPIEYLIKLGVLTAFLITMGYCFKKDRRLFFWLSFFLIALLPYLTPLRIAWVIAERYAYLGVLGIIVLIALAIQKIGEISKRKEVAYVVLGVILLALSARTVLRNMDWKNQDTLWLASAKTSPSSPQNHNNLGDLYGRHGDLERAEVEFKRAIELKPNYGDAYHNLANTYAQMGKIELAMENYQKALSFNPHLWQSYSNLAALYFNQERFDLAQNELEKAVKVNPQNPDLYIDLGVVFYKQGKNEEARKKFLEALQFDPENAKAKALLFQLEKESESKL